VTASVTGEARGCNEGVKLGVSSFNLADMGRSTSKARVNTAPPTKSKATCYDF
jgi:hypothetical protein